MSNIIGEGRFPENVIENDPGISPSNFPENVTLIPTEPNIPNILETQMMDFQEAIMMVINAIIYDGINDYLRIVRPEKVDKENLLQEIDEIRQEMFIKAQGIEDAIDFVGNDEEVGVEFNPEYILGAIELLLNNYRNRVFGELIKNEKRFKSKK